MKIGINARMFDKKQHTGIARSVLEIIKIWATVYNTNEYYLFANNPIDLELELPSNWHIIVEPFIVNKGILWDELKLPILIKKYKIDAFWGTNFSLPHRITNTKYYVSIYDCAAFKVKGVTERNNSIKLKLNVKKACERADKIIAISKATAKDIHDLFKVENSKIAISYCGGLPSNFSRKSYDINTVNKTLVFNEHYFLFISTIEPRKNVLNIIKAFEHFIDMTGENMKLVLAGKIGWMCEDILDAAQKSVYSERIIMPGFISDADKEYLLSNATAFVYPSLYEGFGIPILEAFAFELPVITSNISSMPEVAGNAAFYVENPTDYNELADKMYDIVNMNSNKKRALLERMKNQSACFSWRKNAAELMDLISENS